MKKKILSLAVIAMSMFSINAVAQNPTKSVKKSAKHLSATTKSAINSVLHFFQA